ncbi:phosphoglycerate mutase-like protein [Basidiobolus meristosporus CBS 931.73]|uniref:Phosphoglycerate mutase-like protein n=1 Tax=Basidiobolus meristosporus CBS 931.73 TaxID=1314790 RepID=A0A1Y1YWY5_9FUNG|nr:phosphoglycerate mutase-like protein [Basidiobolus meristosporus CBS 931.73]|eukprot:ORY02207.1 phosphoglycerate mutase-like protein [Basidiobolus meristosporus CBS 931.73]
MFLGPKVVYLLFSSVLPISASLYDDGYNYCQASRPSKSTYKPLPHARLVHVQLVVRHGDRTPVWPLTYEHDVSWDCDEVQEYSRLNGPEVEYDGSEFKYQVIIPKKDSLSSSFWKGSCINGQLTTKGKLQHISLGRALREIYVNKLKFLPKKLSDTRLLFIRSSDVTRTKQSAQSILNGLYPKSKHDTHDPLVIHYEPGEIETMKFNKWICPRYTQLSNDMINTSYYQNYLEEAQELKSKLDRILTPQSLNWPNRTMVSYMDSMRCRQCHQKPLPCRGGECVTKRMTDDLFRLVDKEYAYTHRDAELADKANAVVVGWIMRNILSGIQLTRHSEAKAKFEIFSGHDDTIFGLLGLLKAKDMRWPPFASNIIFELWRNHKNYFVRVIYNGEVLEVKNSWCYLEPKLPASQNDCKASPQHVGQYLVLQN